MLDYYLQYFLPGHLAELLAALAGTYYVATREMVSRSIRLFVYFLWLTLLIDFSGLYAVYAYFTNYENLEFLRDSPFGRNEWYFNIFNIFFYVVYMTFFLIQLKSVRLRRILIILGVFFLLSEIINLTFSGVFFVHLSTYGSISGTVVLVLCIFAYYYEMLRSNSILKFYKEVAFYVSIGVLIRYLVVPPLLIYNKYFSLTSPDFVEMHSFIMSLANLFMYGMFVIGFIVCSGKVFQGSTEILERK